MSKSERLYLKADIDTRNKQVCPDEIHESVRCTVFNNQNGCGYSIYISQNDDIIGEDEPKEMCIGLTHYQAYRIAKWVLENIDAEWCAEGATDEDLEESHDRQ